VLTCYSGPRAIRARDTSLISATDSSNLMNLGFAALGLNPTSSGNTPWIGTGGQFTNEFINSAGEDLVLVIWGVAGSWVNAIQPQVTVSIPANSSQTISFPVGWSGGWAPVFGDSQLNDGQVHDTWGEGTFAPPYSVVDVSREVNMNGRSMSIVTPQCTTDMTTCVFMCQDKSASKCTTGYELVNCASGSQAGAYYGTYDGADSGGCGGMGNSAALQTYFS